MLLIDCGSVPHVARMSGGVQLRVGARVPAGTLASARGGDTQQPIPGRPFRLRPPSLSWEAIRGAGNATRISQGHRFHLFFCL
jgi:hypothetical protein